jgi:hypothetical protein
MRAIQAESQAMSCASRVARIIAGYASRVQPRRPLARLAALMLIAAVAPPMASAKNIAEARDYTLAGGNVDRTTTAEKILRELYGASYHNYGIDHKNRLRECALNDKCLKQLQLELYLFTSY